MHLSYAEQFKCHPQDVGKTVKVRWWIRWQKWEQARASRRAWEHFRQAGNSVKELSDAEHAAKNWALDLPADHREPEPEDEGS